MSTLSSLTQLPLTELEVDDAITQRVSETVHDVVREFLVDDGDRTYPSTTLEQALGETVTRELASEVIARVLPLVLDATTAELNSYIVTSESELAQLEEGTVIITDAGKALTMGKQGRWSGMGGALMDSTILWTLLFKESSGHLSVVWKP